MSARRRPRSRGYTVIEVMMAVVLLVIGSAGIVAMEKAATVGNMRAKELAVATHIGQMWIERLRADGTNWTLPGMSQASAASNLDTTQWLKAANAQPNVWVRPTDVPTRGAAGFDALGNDLPSDKQNEAVYCTHVRMNWMSHPTAGTTSTVPEVVRADVRVFWRREAAFNGQSAAICDPAGGSAATLVTVGNGAFLRYHFAYFTTTIMKNTAP